MALPNLRLFQVPGPSSFPKTCHFDAAPRDFSSTATTTDHPTTAIALIATYMRTLTSTREPWLPIFILFYFIFTPNTVNQLYKSCSLLILSNAYSYYLPHVLTTFASLIANVASIYASKLLVNKTNKHYCPLLTQPAFRLMKILLKASVALARPLLGQPK